MKEGVQVASIKIQLLLSCDIEMRKAAGSDWFKAENLHFVCAVDPSGSVVQLGTPTPSKGFDCVRGNGSVYKGNQLYCKCA